MGIGIFYLCCPCDMDFDLMTFIYELDLYSLKIYRMCEYGLPTGYVKHSKATVWQKHKQTDRNETIYHTVSQVVKKKYNLYKFYHTPTPCIQFTLKYNRKKTLPIVGMVVTISPNFSLYRIVVLPAASSPTIKILISFLPNKPRNSFSKMLPILQ